jgi:hypothetical protein
VGSNIILCAENGGVYITSDYGNTWTLQTSLPTFASWTRVASNSTGSKLIACSRPWQYYNFGGVYISSNYGNTWTLITSLPNGNNENWFSVASNSEGDRLFATGFNYFYMSVNGGTTWAPIIIAGVPPNIDYYCVETNSTGQYLAVTLNINPNNLIYTSNNYGNTWTLSLTIPKLTNTTSCDITGNSRGSKLIAWAIGDDDDNIYISSNYGGSWEIQTQLPPTVGPKGYWNSVACNATGSKLIAIINYSNNTGAIFTWSDSTNQWSKINDNLLPSPLTPFGVCAITELAVNKNAAKTNPVNF